MNPYPLSCPARAEDTASAGSEYFLERYITMTPIPLALVRAVDCRHLAQENWNGEILDVGCGDGIFADILFSGVQGKVAAGVDTNPLELRKAAKTGIYQKLFQADAGSLPFPDQSFDRILCNSVLEHIPDVEKTLTEMARVLRPGGTLTATVPSEYLSDDMFFSIVFKKVGLNGLATWYTDTKNKAWRHYHLDTPAVWKERLERSGFVMKRQRYIHPRELTSLCDIFTLSGVLSRVWLKLFDRHLLFPGRYRARVFGAFLRRYYYAEAQLGSTILFTGVKE